MELQGILYPFLLLPWQSADGEAASNSVSDTVTPEESDAKAASKERI